jgi:hypothetical protein
MNTGSLNCIVTRKGLDYRSSTPGRDSDYSLRHNVQVGPEAHPASYPVGTGVSPRG